MSVLRKLNSEMYTKTRIAPTALEAMATNMREGQLFLKALRHRALLITTAQEFQELEKLPLNLWVLLREDFIKNRVKIRVSSDARAVELDLEPEVVVEEPGNPSSTNPLSTTMTEYVDCEIVARRVAIQNGEAYVQNREEWWREVFYPVLLSFSPNQRTVTIVDEYCVQDFRRTVRGPNGKLSGSVSTECGFVWFATHLQQVSKRGAQPIQLEVITGEANGDDPISRKEIADLRDYLQQKADIGFLDITVRVVPVAHMRPRPTGFLTRRFQINDMSNFPLAKGLRDFSGQRDDSSFTDWQPAVREATLKAVEDLRTLAITV